MIPELHTEFVFDIHVNVEPGKGLEAGVTVKGTRRMIPITGGTFQGPSIKGKIVPGGYDFQLLRNDGVLEIDARYVLQTDDDVNITIVNKGIRHGPPEIMKQMAESIEVPPSQYYFRSVPVFETGADKYQWLNKNIFVASGLRKPSQVIISVFKIL